MGGVCCVGNAKSLRATSGYDDNDDTERPPLAAKPER